MQAVPALRSRSWSCCRLRGEVVTATEALVNVQQQLAAAQAGRVAAEERLEETEARLRVRPSVVVLCCTTAAACAVGGSRQ